MGAALLMTGEDGRGARARGSLDLTGGGGGGEVGPWMGPCTQACPRPRTSAHHASRTQAARAPCPAGSTPSGLLHKLIHFHPNLLSRKSGHLPPRV